MGNFVTSEPLLKDVKECEQINSQDKNTKKEQGLMGLICFLDKNGNVNEKCKNGCNGDCRSIK